VIEEDNFRESLTQILITEGIAKEDIVGDREAMFL
jgi:hypothetical protein